MWNEKMNRPASLYHNTGRGLITLVVLWIVAMVLAALAPAKLRNSDGAFVAFVIVVVALFAAAIVLGVVRIVSYIRWTGKYPYYFLFHKSHRPHEPEDEAPKKERSANSGLTWGLAHLSRWCLKSSYLRLLHPSWEPRFRRHQRQPIF
jgi:Ca2+/Na+ antiporter